ncbi:MAG: ABC transporter ATP-binding protein [Bacteroidota bacterium]
MNAPVLETRNLNKFFHQPVEFHVLKDIDVQVYPGEFVSMVGKSGSGKSTLLYCLSTMDNDYTGELHVLGKKVTGKKDATLAAIRNRNIGFVFQFHYLLPEFTCLKNVMLPALKLGKHSYEEIEARAYKKLEILGLRDQALKQSIKLSGGQQQRVAIARALINEPEVLLCDEPTGNLDSKNTEIVFDVFRQLADIDNKTILVVTHDLDFAEASDRTIVMQDGRVMDNERISN